MKIEVERFPVVNAREFNKLCNNLLDDNKSTRAQTYDIIEKSGFCSSIGGHHVAILYKSGERLAVVTSTTIPDFQ